MTPDTPTPPLTLAEVAPGPPPEAAPPPPRPPPPTPSPEDVETLTTQYKKAVNGLYEAYVFGTMLLAVKARLEGAARPLDPAPAQGAGPRPAPVGAGFVDAEMGNGHDAGTGGLPGSLTRETAREMTVGRNGNILHEGGWNAGTGLKAWLAAHCPEINYKTACRFLAVAERTHAALVAASETSASEASESSASPSSQSIWGPAPCAGAGEGARSPFPPEAAQAPSEAGTPFAIPIFPEATVRAFLEGKSQRAVLRLGGARAGAGRPRKDWAAALGTSPEAAFKRLEEALAPLNELIVVKGTHRLLAAADLETVRAAVALLAARLAEAE